MSDEVNPETFATPGGGAGNIPPPPPPGTQGVYHRGRVSNDPEGMLEQTLRRSYDNEDDEGEYEQYDAAARWAGDVEGRGGRNEGRRASSMDGRAGIFGGGRFSTSSRLSNILDGAGIHITTARGDLDDTPTPTSRPTGQRDKFVRLSDVPDADMLDVDVVLRKEDYGAPGSSDYRKNMAVATAALGEKFGVARHKVTHRTGEAESGDAKGNQHVQHAIVGILHRIKEGHQRAVGMDWMDICHIPKLDGTLSSDDCRDWWDESETNLWLDWDQCSSEQVTAWQYSVNKRFSAEDRIASRWLKEFVYNSSTDSLRSAVGKKYDKLSPVYKGGVMYLFLTLCEMFHMSREVKAAIFSFIALFKKKGVARYTGENVVTIYDELIGCCKRLAVDDSLTDEHVFDILEGLSICTVQRFRDMFALMKQNADIGNQILPSIPDDATPMEKIEAILEKAVDQYDKLCTAQKWNVVKGKPYAGLAAGGGETICWNCEQPGCTVGKCPKPRDQARINKNKQAFEERKRNGGQSGESNGGSNGGNRNGNRRPKKDSSSEYQRKKWASMGMHMVNGTLMVSCKVCGLNTTHSSKHHAAYSANPGSFKLPASHAYCIEVAKLAANKSVPPDSVAPGSASTGQSSLTPPSNGALTFNRSDIETKLANIERQSTNPNAAEVCSVIRDLFQIN